MKSLFIGFAVAAALPLLTIYLSDFFLFDIPVWAAWPLVGIPVVGGAAIGLINFVYASQNAQPIRTGRHHT